MTRTIVFCAGDFGRRYIHNAAEDENIIAVVDNDKNKTDRFLCGYRIQAPHVIKSLEFDKIVICINDTGNERVSEAMKNIMSIIKQLRDLPVDDDKIYIHRITDTLAPNLLKRIEWLRQYAQTMAAQRLPAEGAVAECGVHNAMFATFINEFFPGRKLFLYDTFTGFDETDLECEENNFKAEIYSHLKVIDVYRVYDDSKEVAFLPEKQEELALLRCIHRKNIEILKGRIPETLDMTSNEKYLFVNLDMDLYLPTLEALRYFAVRMVQGGIILVHDYYNRLYGGVKRAVDEFANEKMITLLPIGDNCSMAVSVCNGNILQ